MGRQQAIWDQLSSHADHRGGMICLHVDDLPGGGDDSLYIGQDSDHINPELQKTFNYLNQIWKQS
eukprot:16281618-Heterocapsa_arctica.AAC.1